jgi:hypothetical protein
VTLLVSQRHRVHRIPPPTFVTFAKRPSQGGGTRGLCISFGKNETEIFSLGYLDNPNRLELAREIRFFAQARFWRVEP